MIKKIVISLAAVLCAASAFAQKDTLRVLAIGNSFSVDATSDYLYDIAKAGGYEFIIGSINVGGCPLEKHWNFANSNHVYSYSRCEGGKWRNSKSTMQDAMAGEKWDFITFQQASPLSGKWETFEPFLTNLVNLARKMSPGATVCFQQTWAYAKDATHGGFKNYNRDQMTMYNAILDADRKACEAHGLKIIPSGTAIQNGRTTFIGQNFVRDGFHMSYTCGRFTVACTWFEALTGQDVTLNSYAPEWMQPAQIAVCKRSAHEANLQPWGVTSLKEAFKSVVASSNDRSKLPVYQLPDPLTMADGSRVKNKKQWYDKRRPELLELFTTEMFGKVPTEDIKDISWEVVESGDAFDGLATRKQVKFTFADIKNVKKGKGRTMMLLVYTPKNAKGKAPMFLGMNFKGNHAVCDDPAIILPKGGYGIYEKAERGAADSRWNVRTILERGYGLATLYRADIFPDYDSRECSIVSLYEKDKKGAYRSSGNWGCIAAWAWSLSRAMDYLESDSDVDAKRVAVIGHSRLGKTALWAGAQDQRFAMVISNNSGCGGAALSRGKIGETVKIINSFFPHWFCGNFKKYNDNEGALPFDQHELLSLIAPRPLYVASSDQDLWADPENEKRSLDEAGKVYKFLGVNGKTAYHIKKGRHSITAEDWAHYLDFADKNLK